VQLATRIARGTAAGPGATIAIGRLGEVHFDSNGVGPMGKPFVYDQSNVMDFAKVF
jgi:rhamnose transport system substrate-binding protein